MREVGRGSHMLALDIGSLSTALTALFLPRSLRTELVSAAAAGVQIDLGSWSAFMRHGSLVNAG